MVRDRSDPVPVVSRFFERAADRVASLSRYDFVLALLPLAFCLAFVAGSLFAIPARTAVLAAAGICLLALLDAMFLNPPRSERRA